MVLLYPLYLVVHPHPHISGNLVYLSFLGMLVDLLPVLLVSSLHGSLTYLDGAFQSGLFLQAVRGGTVINLHWREMGLGVLLLQPTQPLTPRQAQVGLDMSGTLLFS